MNNTEEVLTILGRVNTLLQKKGGSLTAPEFAKLASIEPLLVFVNGGYQFRAPDSYVSKSPEEMAQHLKDVLDKEVAPGITAEKALWFCPKFYDQLVRGIKAKRFPTSCQRVLIPERGAGNFHVPKSEYDSVMREVEEQVRTVHYIIEQVDNTIFEVDVNECFKPEPIIEMVFYSRAPVTYLRTFIDSNWLTWAYRNKSKLVTAQTLRSYLDAIIDACLKRMYQISLPERNNVCFLPIVDSFFLSEIEVADKLAVWGKKEDPAPEPEKSYEYKCSFSIPGVAIVAAFLIGLFVGKLV